MLFHAGLLLFNVLGHALDFTPEAVVVNLNLVMLVPFNPGLVQFHLLFLYELLEGLRLLHLLVQVSQ